MPHQPKPFFKANRGVWYVELDRKQISLGKQPQGLPAPCKKDGTWQAPPSILAAFYKVMVRDSESATPSV